MGPEAKFINELENGTFVYQECRDCKSAIFYPRVLCTACGSSALDWKESQLKGTIYSYTSIPKRDGSFTINAIVDLDEKIRILVRIGIESPEAVKIGMAVQGRIEKKNDTAIVVFEEI